MSRSRAIEPTDLQGLRRWMLATRDAHSLYRKTGFKELHDATRFMERFDMEVYSRKPPT